LTTLSNVNNAYVKERSVLTVEGAKVYERDLPKLKLHLLDTGHFALEEEGDFIAGRLTAFLGRSSAAREVS